MKQDNRDLNRLYRFSNLPTEPAEPMAAPITSLVQHAIEYVRDGDTSGGGSPDPPAPIRHRRVVLAVNSITYGGVEEHVSLLGGGLLEIGQTLTVLLPQLPGLETLTDRLDHFGIPYCVQNMHAKGLLTKWQVARKMAATLHQLRAEILHVHLVGFDGGRIPILAGRLAGIPIVVTHHIAPKEDVAPLIHATRRPFLRSVDTFISVSDANRSAQVKYLRLPSDQTVTVHNGIVIAESIDRASAKSLLARELSIAPDAPIVGCVGRLEAQKGLHWLIDAAPAILARVPNAQFVFVGEGSLRDALSLQAQNLGIAQHIHWLGFRSDARDIAAGFDLLAMPSEYEGLPITLLEAMVRQVPIVAHDVDGIPEAVTDGKEGYLVPKGDTKKLADKIAILLLDPELARQMGQRARCKAVKEFSVRSMSEKVAGIYAEILSRGEPDVPLSLESAVDAPGSQVPASDSAQPVRRTRLRVALLTESFMMGGVERSTAMLLKSMNLEKFEPILICGNHASIEEMVAEVQQAGIQVVRAQTFCEYGRHSGLAQFRNRVRQFRQLNIDLLHIQMLGGSGSRWNILAAKAAGIRNIIITVRGQLHHQLPFFDRMATHITDRLVSAYTVASNANKVAQVGFAGRNSQKVKVIHNGINVHDIKCAFPRNEARAALGIREDAQVIATIGRMDPQKGIEHFLRMAKRVVQTHPDAKFVIIGDGPHKAEYEAISAAEGLTNAVKFAGYFQDAYKYLTAADVAVVSSIFEPFGLVVAEAMAVGVPLVASNVGGIPEVAVDGETALLVPPGDSVALAQAVTTYLDNPELARKHAVAGKQRVEMKFTTSRLATEFEELYLTVAAQQNS